MVLKRHLKRIVASRFWPIARKKSMFVIRPYPSGLSMDYTLPLGFVLKEIIKIARNNKEAKYLISNKKVLINNKAVSDVKSPLKLFDTLSVPEMDKYYRISLSNKGKLILVDIDADEAKKTISKIINKRLIKKGRTQFNFMDGTNLLSEENYPMKSTIVFELPSRKVLSILTFEPGSKLFVIKGSHIGSIVTLKEIRDRGDSFVVDADGNEFLSSDESLIVIGKDSPMIKLND